MHSFKSYANAFEVPISKTCPIVEEKKMTGRFCKSREFWTGKK